MTLRHFKVFLVVYEEGSMTKAAKRLYVSQPSVSQAIAELERHYQTRLFNRISKKLYPTPYADKLRRHALNFITLTKEIERDMGNELSDKINIRVGASVTIGDTFFCDLIRSFCDKHPDYSIASVINNAEHIEKMVSDDNLDLAIIAAASISYPDITAVPLHMDDLVFVFNKNYPVLNKDSIKLEELVRHPLILREKGSSIRQTIEVHRIPITIVGEYNSSQAILKAISCGIGVSVMPWVYITRNEPENLHYLKIDHPDFTRTYWLIYKKSSGDALHVQLFEAFSNKYMKQLSR